ncbi:MAG: protein TonB [Candidatus Azotimanducaceae bacterium]|jgi:protein TonB
MTPIHPSIKFLTVTLAALVSTGLCFYLMLFLIANELTSRIEVSPRAHLTPSINEPKEPTKVATRAKPKKKLPTQPPPDPIATMLNLAWRVEFKAERPTFGSIADQIGPIDIQLHLEAPHSDLAPLFVVQPIYPLVAVMREIEGFVVVEFSVRDNGTVANPIVVQSEPDVIFDQAALNAVSRFKFKPRNVGEDFVQVDKVRLKFAFQLDSLYDIEESYIQ